MRANYKSYQVMPHPSGGWALKAVGSGRAMKVFDTKKEATDWARKVIMNKKDTRFVIHGRDGMVQREVISGHGRLRTASRRGNVHSVK